MEKVLQPRLCYGRGSNHVPHEGSYMACESAAPWNVPHISPTALLSSVLWYPNWRAVTQRIAFTLGEREAAALPQCGIPGVNLCFHRVLHLDQTMASQTGVRLTTDWKGLVVLDWGSLNVVLDEGVAGALMTGYIQNNWLCSCHALCAGWVWRSTALGSCNRRITKAFGQRSSQQMMNQCT